MRQASRRHWYERPRSRFRLGLRDRVTLGFGLLALGLSVLLAATTWTLVSHYLLSQRESSAAAEASVDAGLLQRQLDSGTSDVVQALDAASTGTSAAVLRYDGGWYAGGGAVSPASLPSALVNEVSAGRAGEQRIDIDGRPTLVVGMPMKKGSAYYALYDLAELDRTFRVLSTSLAVAAALTVACGLVLGRSASRRALRPLTALNTVAQAVAGGRLTARMDAKGDPDLAPLSRSFNETVEALQRRVRADARFAGDVSHELRTPLTTMLNSMEVLQNRRDRMPEEVREPLDLLAEDLERFRRMVVDLLEISRLEDGQEITAEPVAIGELVRRAANHAAGREVTSVSADAEDLVMLADKRRLERVVANLVENAERHGGGCTAVSVRVARGGTAVVVAVDDAGPGVPPDRRALIFERFNRGGPPDAGGAAGGVGLGLAIVSRHVGLHRGRVDVLDAPGGGARFQVTLPVDPGRRR